MLCNSLIYGSLTPLPYTDSWVRIWLTFAVTHNKIDQIARYNASLTPINVAIDISSLLRTLKRHYVLKDVLFPRTANWTYVPKIRVVSTMHDGIKMLSTRQSFCRDYSFFLFAWLRFLITFNVHTNPSTTLANAKNISTHKKTNAALIFISKNFPTATRYSSLQFSPWN